MHSELEHVEFVALNDVNAFNLENPLMGLSEGGMVFVQSHKQRSRGDLGVRFPPGRARRCARRMRACSRSTRWGSRRQVSSRADLQQRMQGIVLLGIFLRITPFQTELRSAREDVFTGVEKSLRKYFGKRGERVVQDNLEAVQRGYHEVIEVPREVMLSTAEADKANAALRVM